MTRRGAQDIDQPLPGQMHGTGAGDQHPVALQQPHRQLVGAPVGLLAVGNILAAGDKGRRIQDYHIVALPLVDQRLHHRHRIALQRVHPVVDTVQRRILRHPLKGGTGAVDTGDGPGTEPGGLDTPAAAVAEHIQHPPVAHVIAQSRPVGAMIEKPAGFLAAERRRREAKSVFLQSHRLRYLAVGHRHRFRQGLGAAHAAVITQQDAGGRKHLYQRLHNGILERLHTRGGDLHHQHIAEAVHHQTGQKITVAVNQAVVGPVGEPPTQAEGDIETMHQQRFVEGNTQVPGKQPPADQTVGVDGRQAQCLAPGALHHDLLPGLKGFQRRRRRVHLVAVNPQMPAAQTTVGAVFQFEHIECGFCHGGEPGREAYGRTSEASTLKL